MILINLNKLERLILILVRNLIYEKPSPPIYYFIFIRQLEHDSSSNQCHK